MNDTTKHTHTQKVQSGQLTQVKPFCHFYKEFISSGMVYTITRLSRNG